MADHVFSYSVAVLRIYGIEIAFIMEENSTYIAVFSITF